MSASNTATVASRFNDSANLNSVTKAVNKMADEKTTVTIETALSRVFIYVVGTVITAALLSMIPFAMSITGRLSAIEQRLTITDELRQRVNACETNETAILIRMAKMKENQ